MKRLSVFGLGYVGSVTAACLARQGNQVIGVDVNPMKVDMLNGGKSPVLEDGLDEFVANSRRDDRLRATVDTAAAILDSDISIICVGTPSLRNGKLDVSVVERVCRDIGGVLQRKRDFHLVVVRSTVLPGTAERLAIPAIEDASGKKSGIDFGVCVNPEFLREGSAVRDFFEPPLTVMGSAERSHSGRLRELFSWVTTPVFETSLAAAEMVKYACNSYHALKIAFANELGTLCRDQNIDAEEVMEIFLSDKRLNISSAYLRPGFAFGGSCLPKDLRALVYRAKELDSKLPLMEAIIPSNTEHLDRAVDIVLQTNKRKVALLGLSFKPGTDDLRESPQVALAKRLIGEGCEVRIWDPHVSLGRLVGSNREFIEEFIPHIGSLLCDSLETVLREADLVVIGTTAPETAELTALLQNDHTVIDLVNLGKGNRPRVAGGYHGICW